jgi:metallo-beta-lactamase family protein
MITGFQAEHTLGRKIQEGISPVRIFGQMHNVRAQVITLDGLSAHADQDDLLNYIRRLEPNLKNLFLIHTELPQASAFKEIVQKQFPNLSITIPSFGQSFDL